jgi:hypothetical protein
MRPYPSVQLPDCQANWEDYEKRMVSAEGKLTLLQAFVPSQPLLDFVTGAIGIYGPFTADFTAVADQIGPHAEKSKTVSVSSFISTRTPIIVLMQNRDGVFMSRVSTRAVRNSGSVDIVAYNNDAANTAAGYVDFVLLA